MLDQIFRLGTSNIKLHTNTNKIRLEKGVRQGDSISPKLFTACLENVFRGLNWTSKGIPINGDRLTNLRFADDVVLFSESPQELQLMVEELRTASSKVGLEINLSKTKVMFNRNIEIQPIMTGNVALDQVDRYIYLGQLISIHRDWEPEVRRRVALGWQAFGRLNNVWSSKLPLCLKRKWMLKGVSLLPCIRNFVNISPDSPAAHMMFIFNVYHLLKYGYRFASNDFVYPLQENSLDFDDQLSNPEETHFKVAVMAGDKKYEMTVKRKECLEQFYNGKDLNEKYCKSCTIHPSQFTVNGRQAGGFTLAVRHMLRNVSNESSKKTDHFHSLCRISIPKALTKQDKSKLIVGFDDPACNHTELVGGKGSSLAKLSMLEKQVKTGDVKNSFTVPRGCCLTVNAFRQHLEANSHLQSALNDFQLVTRQVKSSKNLQEESEKLVKEIKSTEISKELKDEIENLLLEIFGEEFGNSTRLAVRSSAVGEDSEEMSAAGQLTTFLGVNSLDNYLKILFIIKKPPKEDNHPIWKAILGCWASQMSYQAVEYNRQHGQLINQGMGVVLQEMVNAEAAGVMFTQDHISANPSKLTITCNFGLGESVVSASADPDTFVLQKLPDNKIEIFKKFAGKKGVVISMDEHNGTIEKQLEDSEKFSITDEMAEELGNIGVMARPITSFDLESDYELIHEHDSPIKSRYDVMSTANIGEIYLECTQCGFKIGMDLSEEQTASKSRFGDFYRFSKITIVIKFSKSVSKSLMIYVSYSNLCTTECENAVHFNGQQISTSEKICHSITDVMDAASDVMDAVRDVIPVACEALLSKMLLLLWLRSIPCFNDTAATREALPSAENAILISNITFVTWSDDVIYEVLPFAASPLALTHTVQLMNCAIGVPRSCQGHGHGPRSWSWSVMVWYSIVQDVLSVHICDPPQQNEVRNFTIRESFNYNYIPYSNNIMTSFHRRMFISTIDCFYRMNEKTMSDRNKAFEVAIFGRLLNEEKYHQYALIRHGIPSAKNGLLRLFYTLYDIYINKECVEAAKNKFKNYENDWHKFDSALELHQAIIQKSMDVVEVFVNHGNASLSSIVYCLIILIASQKKEWDLDDYADIAVILGSCNEVESAGVPLLMQELSDTISKEISPEEFSGKTAEDALHWLEEESKMSSSKFKEFLKLHWPQMYSRESWGMNPKKLVKSLQIMVKTTAGIKTNDKPSQSMDEMLDSLKKPLPKMTRRIFKWIVPKCRDAVGCREQTKSMLILVVDSMRKGFRRLGELMVHEGFIPDSELVFFFTHMELEKFMKTRNPRTIAKAMRRRRLHKQLNDLRFPELSDGYPQPIMEDEIFQDGGSCIVTGTPVCHGTIKATARVITDVANAVEIEPGDILITRATDIGWSPYFPILGGVVTELGGLVSHGAVVAREYGLPCIVGAKGATNAFKSGDKVLLNASKGIVQKIE
ncbi:putative phosphoenolpyruvate synthase [Nymphon striatum]|nr:putative phosphoenolpyruvate synthase [Nymphon striatum]